MTKTRPWSELEAKFMSDPARRARVEEGTRAIEVGLALSQLRSKLGMQEYDVPEPLADQAVKASDAEDTEGVFLATLRGYIEAMGGSLEINAVFPDGTLALLPGPRRWSLMDSNGEHPSGAPVGRSATG
jgi:hypothetical protein